MRVRGLHSRGHRPIKFYSLPVANLRHKECRLLGSDAVRLSRWFGGMYRSLVIFTLMMGAIISSEMSVLTRVAWCRN
jgi:hypothetical protein